MGLKPRTPRDLGARIAAIVPRLFEADLAYRRSLDLDPGITFAEALGPPATDAEIDDLESYLGRPPPPSYRAFLSRYSRWDGMPGCGGAILLGPTDHRSAHIRNVLSNKSALLDQFEETNPIAAGAIPLALGDDRNMPLLEPPAAASGEMAIVKYYLTGEEGRYTVVGRPTRSRSPVNESWWHRLQVSSVEIASISSAR